MSPSQPTAEQAKLGPLLATVLVAGNMIGSGVYLLPVTLATIGSISMIGWVVAAAGALALAGVFAILVRLRPHAEGMQDYAREGLGRFFGYQASLAYWFSDVVGDVALAVGVTGAIAVLLPMLAKPMPGLACTIAVLWAMVMLNIIGPKMTARYGAATLAIGLLPIAGVAAFGWFWFDPQVFAHAWNVSGKPVLGAVQASLVSVFWAFTGVESATVAASVVRNPERNVPIAAIGGVALAAVIYILASAAMFGLLPSAEMAASTAPFASATGKVMGAAAAGLVALCALLKASGTLGGWILLTAETSRSSAVLGFFPRWLARTRADGTPVPGLILTGVLTTLGALVTVSPTLGEQFNVLINVATVLALVIYGYCALALLRFSREMPTAGGRVLAAGLGTAGAAFCVWLIVTSDPKLLWWSVAVLALCVPAWIAFRIVERRRAQAATTS